MVTATHFEGTVLKLTYVKFIIPEEFKDGNNRRNESFPTDRAKMAIFVGTDGERITAH